MFLRSSISMLAILGTLSGIAAAESQSQSADACFADHTVTKVLPHHAAVAAGQGTYDRLVGARAYVPAKPGLTGEWLHAQLAKRSSTPKDGTECPLDVPNLDISVRSAGPGFWVSLSTKDADQAKEVLRRAQALAR